jgi:hypothetical protein
LVTFTTTIKQFGKQGEKTGWTYIDVPADLACRLKKNNRIGFRVKGKLDEYRFEGMALIPMGKGDFILPLNASVRKQIHKGKGAMLKVQLAEDKKPYLLNADFMASLDDEPAARKFFDTLSNSHRNYFSKWIDSAKTEETKIRRIAMSVNALMKGWGYPEMLKARKE